MLYKNNITAITRPTKPNKDGVVYLEFYACHHLGKGSTKDYPRRLQMLYRKDGSKIRYRKDKASKKEIESLKYEANQIVGALNVQYAEERLFGIDTSLLETPLYTYWSNYLDNAQFNNYITEKHHRMVCGWFGEKFPTLRINQLNSDISQQFYNHLLTFPSKRGGERASSTAIQYLTKYKYIINRLKKEGLIKKDILDIRTQQIRKKIKPYLTAQELSVLYNTPITSGHNSIKRAFLFGCYTGLRSSDLTNLTWDKIVEQDGKLYVSLVMQKVNLFNSVQLNEVAEEMIFSNDEGINRSNFKKYSVEKVFSHYYGSNNQQQNLKIQRWIKEDCGINKHITPKVARDSFAINFYTSTFDILATSKLLGHTDTQTTMKYLNSYGVNTEGNAMKALQVPAFK
jgi:integrase